MKEIYEFGDFRADPAEQLLLHRGQPVALTPKVFETLLILLKSEGRLIDKDDFIRQLWPGVFVEDVALAKNISYLRRALGDGKNGVDLIQTVPKRGYRFAAPVRKVSEQKASLSNNDQDVPTERLATAMPAKKWVFAFLIALAIAIGAGAFLLLFHGKGCSAQMTLSCLLTLLIRPVTRCLTTPCAEVWQCSLNSHLF